MHRDRMEEIVFKANGMGYSSAIISELQQLLALLEKEFVLGELEVAEEMVIVQESFTRRLD